MNLKKVDFYLDWPGSKNTIHLRRFITENLMKKEAKNSIFFEGRLARYTYYNTDEVIERALDLYLNLKKKFKKIKN